MRFRSLLVLLPLMTVSCSSDPAPEPPVAFKKAPLLPGENAPAYKQDAKTQERPTLGPSALPETAAPLTPDQIIPVDIQGRIEIDEPIGAPYKLFFPRTQMKTGDFKRMALGKRTDGGILAYTIGGPEKGQIPVTVSLNIWGSHTLNTTWIARLKPGTSTDFFTATPAGQRARIVLFVEALAPLPEDSLDIKPIDPKKKK